MNNIINLFSMAASELSDDQFEQLYQKLKDLNNTEPYIVINTGEKKYKIKTEHAFLEIERMRKNSLLKNRVNKLVRVNGTADSVKMHPRSGLFCLSNCEINGVDVGHTWVKYNPSFKNVKLGSSVSFFSEITKYGDLNNKSGVNWREIANVRISGGDNSSLFKIPLEESDLIYTPKHKPSLKKIEFENGIYDTLNRKLYVNGNEYETDKTLQKDIDKLLFYEWFARLEEWEFWYVVQRNNNDQQQILH